MLPKKKLKDALFHQLNRHTTPTTATNAKYDGLVLVNKFQLQ